MAALSLATSARAVAVVRFMNKATKSISLVLISSTVLYLGCSRECKEKLADGRPNPKCAGAHGGGHVVGTGLIHGSGQSTTTVPGGASSTRGGFGASGAVHGGGSS